MTSVTFQHVKQKTRFDLPAPITREIGRIIVRWAYYERYIQTIIWAITLDGYENGAALGRVAIRETKPEEQLDLLERVAELRDIKLNASLLKSMKPPRKNFKLKAQPHIARCLDSSLWRMGRSRNPWHMGGIQKWPARA